MNMISRLLLQNENKVFIPGFTKGEIDESCMKETSSSCKDQGYLLNEILSKRLCSLDEELKRRFIAFINQEIKTIRKGRKAPKKFRRKLQGQKSFDIVYETIGLALKKDVVDYMNKLINKKSKLGAHEIIYIHQAIKLFGTREFMKIEEVPCKENISLISVALEMAGVEEEEHVKIMLGLIKDARDVLLIAGYLCDKAFSLENVEVFKLSSPSRRIVLKLLDSLYEPEYVMKKDLSEWKKLARTLHAGSKKKQYPTAHRAIDLICNNPKSIKNYQGLIEEAFFKLKEAKNVDTYLFLINRLREDPNEFASRLVQLLSFGIKTSFTIKEFNRIIESINRKTLKNLLEKLKKLNVSCIEIEDLELFIEALKNEFKRREIKI